MEKLQEFFALVKDFILGYVKMIKKLIDDLKGIHDDPTTDPVA